MNWMQRDLTGTEKGVSPRSVVLYQIYCDVQMRGTRRRTRTLDPLVLPVLLFLAVSAEVNLVV